MVGSAKHLKDLKDAIGELSRVCLPPSLVPSLSGLISSGWATENTTQRQGNAGLCHVISLKTILFTRGRFLAFLEIFADTGAQKRDLKLAGNRIKSSKGFWWLSSLSDMYAIYGDTLLQFS